MGFMIIADWLKTLGLIVAIIFVMGYMQGRDEIHRTAGRSFASASN